MQHGTGDFDHLLLGGAKQPDGCGRRDVEIERLQELLRSDVDAAQAVIEFLLAQKQVLGDSHGRHQAVFLKNHGDAEMARFQRCSGRGLNAVDLHGAGSQRDDAGHHLCQCRFACAVFPNEGMNLAAPKLEIDILDRRNARIKLCRLAKREDDIAHARSSASIMGSGRRSKRPGPLASANSAPFSSTAATMPWLTPSTRLCSA